MKVIPNTQGRYSIADLVVTDNLTGEALHQRDNGTIPYSDARSCMQSLRAELLPVLRDTREENWLDTRMLLQYYIVGGMLTSKEPIVATSWCEPGQDDFYFIPNYSRYCINMEGQVIDTVDGYHYKVDLHTYKLTEPMLNIWGYAEYMDVRELLAMTLNTLTPDCIEGKYDYKVPWHKSDFMRKHDVPSRDVSIIVNGKTYNGTDIRDAMSYLSAKDEDKVRHALGDLSTMAKTLFPTEPPLSDENAELLELHERAKTFAEAAGQATVKTVTSIDNSTALQDTGGVPCTYYENTIEIHNDNCNADGIYTFSRRPVVWNCVLEDGENGKYERCADVVELLTMFPSLMDWLGHLQYVLSNCDYEHVFTVPGLYGINIGYS